MLHVFCERCASRTLVPGPVKYQAAAGTSGLIVYPHTDRPPTPKRSCRLLGKHTMPTDGARSVAPHDARRLALDGTLATTRQRSKIWTT